MPATREFNRFSLAPNLPGGFVASVKRHHTAQQGGQCELTVFSFVSLLERKQKEKICFHNIPEGGV